MFELVIRALCDTCPRTVDVAYLFAQTPDNQASVLFKGRQLLEKGITCKVMLCKRVSGAGI